MFPLRLLHPYKLTNAFCYFNVLLSCVCVWVPGGSAGICVESRGLPAISFVFPFWVLTFELSPDLCGKSFYQLSGLNRTVSTF